MKLTPTPPKPYPEGVPIASFNVKVLVSISHWGVFDIAPYGMVVRDPGQVEIYFLGQHIDTEKCDTEALMEVCRPIFD